VEEPEAFLHPGAIQVLRDGLMEASRSRQVIVTTHSPDLLDDPDIPLEYIRTVRRDDQGTQIDSWTTLLVPLFEISVSFR
jgi:predicted ATP-dependent endonuclease of OLD family